MSGECSRCGGETFEVPASVFVDPAGHLDPGVGVVVICPVCDGPVSPKTYVVGGPETAG